MSPAAAHAMPTKTTTDSSATPTKRGLGLKRFFTTEGVHPFDAITWVQRDAVLGGADKKVFEQTDVEFPESWSSNAVNITTSKYFRGKLGTPQRETSVKQMIGRVTTQLREWGLAHGYFDTAAEADVFEHELAYALVNQIGSFNSPVWFNVGTTKTPQCSACFILAVDDKMDDILEWIKIEGKIFKGGSGSGISLSKLRSSRESLSQGGRASGPVSFMRGADAVAGMIKSGGTTRRAAKMVTLSIDHPDVTEFIRCKADEEQKIRALMDAGYNMASLNDPAWNSIQYQNANNSVSVTDEFMQAVDRDGEWQTHFITTGEVADTFRARDLLRDIAQAAWECGDPGLHFISTMNAWHTTPWLGPITASNPCSEYISNDNSACNLASINLLKFLRDDGTFKTRDFMHTVRLFATAQDIIVSGSSYPTEEIEKNARTHRQLGLGYANLGALLMTKGLAYDSEAGRAWAGAITSVMTGTAYHQSTVLAERVGPFEAFSHNREPMLRVLDMHRDQARQLSVGLIDDEQLATTAQRAWDETVQRAGKHGVRNAQVTVIAPTGTISFMMDCATTGMEPDFSLVKMKQLVGGSWMKIVNDSVPEALRRLGYTEAATQEMVDYIVENQTIEGAPHLTDEHLPIFDCAVRSAKGTRSISWKGHVKMVAAIQPFISGAISKTFNMPHETTPEEISEAYVMAWRLGVKAFAVYRDGSKATQPLQTAAGNKKHVRTAAGVADAAEHLPESARRRLPTTRASETHKFSVAGHEGYITIGMYEDGAPGEVFIKVSKQGSTLAGLLDSFSIAVSIALQYGVPLKTLTQKFIHTRFEPAGFTENPNIQVATSIVDYVARYLALHFLDATELADLGLAASHTIAAGVTPVTHDPAAPVATFATATVHLPQAMPQTKIAETVCRKCGGMMVRTGTCQTCLQCGEASGGC